MSDALVTDDRPPRVSDAAHARLLILAWVIALGSYLALLIQTIGFEVFGVLNFSQVAVGTILVLRRPGNVIGPLLVVIGSGMTVVYAACVTADTLAAGGDVMAAGWVALVANVATVPILWVGNVALWLLVSGDRPPTPARLLILAWVIGVTSYLAILTQTIGFEVFGVLNFSQVAVGTILVRRRPGNVIGPLLVVIGVGWTVVYAACVTADTLAGGGDVVAAGWVALVANVATVPLLWVGNIALWLLFPGDRSLTPGERRFLVISGVWALAGTAVTAFALPQPLGPDSPTQPHPFLDGVDEGSIGTILGGLFVVPMFLCGIVLAIRLIVRGRRTDAVERRQIVVVAVGVVLYLSLLLVNGFAQPLGSPDERAFLVLDGVAKLVLAVAFGVAIMRYRLYEIDAIISKSVAYLGLAVSITALYAAIVVVPLLIIGLPEDGGPGLALPIAATAVVAVLFEPIRSRLQHWANRLVYGDRATPQEVLSQLTDRLSENAAGGSTDELARLLAAGTGAEQAVVWVRTGDRLVADGSWPTGLAAVEPADTDGAAPDAFSMVEPVRHHDDPLGALSITKPADDPVTPADRELLADVAAGAALVLRNLRLNHELEERANEVRESRRRLIAAQDAERHRLERNLHDGAQQEVVALKVKLGLAKTIAGREGAEDIATMVDALADTTQGAVDAMRAVAHGIYPPLLEAEGLAVALTAVARTSPVPLTIETDGVGRHERRVEETVYFCVLEAIDTAHMAGARNLHVTVTDTDRHLELTIDHDAPSDIDLTTMDDRIDAIDGTLSTHEHLGPDTTHSVTCLIPTAEPMASLR